MKNSKLIICCIILLVINTSLPALVSKVPVISETIPLFFSDGTLALEPEDKEAYLEYLNKLKDEKKLFFLSIDKDKGRIRQVAVLDISLFESECSGVSYGIISSGGDYLIGNMEGLKEREFGVVIPEETYIFPQKYEFEFNGNKYELSSTGKYVGEEYDYAKNVQIIFKDINNNTSQVLTTIPQLEYTLPSVLFIGDIDGDGKPDLILQEGYNYEFSEKVLYLSSPAKKGQLLKRTGISGMWHDC